MSEAEPSRVGTVIASKYRLDEELGRGGMGAVYRAFHLRVHKVFALKMLLGDVARHRSIASRFLLEAQAAGRIGHPGILDVYDVGEDSDGTPFIVMELLRGEALSSLVRRERLDVEAACWIAMEVLDVLDAAHKAGIIHRDVKPQNVFITEKVAGGAEGADGVARGVKLLDFGIAKFSGGVDGSALTRSGEIIGSPLYMAPEQAKGEPDLDERADLWSVGAMLFEMLTGQCAHAATTPVAVLAKILTEEAPLPSARDGRVPPELDLVVARALRIDRAERWPSARTMRDAIAEVRASLGAASLPKIPPAVKTSVPPPSNDRTPGAITSTLAAPSDAPRPWSHAPSPAPVADAVAAGTTVPSGGSPSRGRKIAGALVAVIALVAFAPRLVARFSTATSGAAAAGGSAAVAPSAPVDTASAATGPSARGDAPIVDAAPSSSSAATAPSPADAAPAQAAAPAAGGAQPSRPTVARCREGEVLSNGHCCARGLEWQGGRCERPLATSF